MSKLVNQQCGPAEVNVPPQLLLGCCLNQEGIDRSNCGNVQPGCPQCDQIVEPFCRERGASVPECACIYGREELLDNLRREGITVLQGGINIQNGPAVCWYAGCQRSNVYIPNSDRLLRSSCPNTQVCLVTGNVNINNSTVKNAVIGNIDCRQGFSAGSTGPTGGTTGPSGGPTGRGQTDLSNISKQTQQQDQNPFTQQAGPLLVWQWILVGVGILLLILIIVGFALRARKNKADQSQRNNLKTKQQEVDNKAPEG